MRGSSSIDEEFSWWWPGWGWSYETDWSYSPLFNSGQITIYHGSSDHLDDGSFSTDTPGWTIVHES